MGRAGKACGHMDRTAERMEPGLVQGENQALTIKKAKETKKKKKNQQKSQQNSDLVVGDCHLKLWNTRPIGGHQ